MAPTPAVSIVLPARDAEQTLPSALESIQSQVFQDWELIAVDDGSRDRTAHLLQSAAAGDPRIRVLSQPAQGIVAGLQRGCAAGRGLWIARMDADDWMHPQRLIRQVDFLERHPEIGLVSCQVRYGGDATAQAGYAAHVEWINSLLTPAELSLRRFVEAPVAHPTVVFRRDLLTAHGGYRAGDFPEDYELWLRWLDAGVQFGKVARELLVWNDPPSRLSRTASQYGTDAFYRLKCDYLARWLKRHVHPARELWLWGSGRITRQRFQNLETYGLRPVGFVDVAPKKWGRQRDGRPVVGPEKLPDRGRAFVLAGVAVRGARDYIASVLNGCGWVEGQDYLLAA
jgi:glycosyltransferase involved in cell wall biosynthesis